MTSPANTSGIDGEEQSTLEAVQPPVGPSNTKTLQHQVREIHRLVDHAMENLEQVVRALRYIDRDL